MYGSMARFSMVHFIEAVKAGDITDDTMEQNELVPVEQGKDEGDDQLKHWELPKEPHPGTLLRTTCKQDVLKNICFSPFSDQLRT